MHCGREFIEKWLQQYMTLFFLQNSQLQITDHLWLVPPQNSLTHHHQFLVQKKNLIFFSVIHPYKSSTFSLSFLHVHTRHWIHSYLLELRSCVCITVCCVPGSFYFNLSSLQSLRAIAVSLRWSQIRRQTCGIIFYMLDKTHPLQPLLLPSSRSLLRSMKYLQLFLQ